MAKRKYDYTDEGVIRFRCREFLKPRDRRSGSHSGWVEGQSPDTYIGSFNVIAESDGENYFIGAKLTQKREGRRAVYRLSFDDMTRVLKNQGYRPLRQLGRQVFSRPQG